jgi:hypothetical protein
MSKFAVAFVSTSTSDTLKLQIVNASTNSDALREYIFECLTAGLDNDEAINDIRDQLDALESVTHLRRYCWTFECDAAVKEIR